MTPAQSLEAKALGHELDATRLDEMARRVFIAGADEIGEMLVTLDVTNLVMRRPPELAPLTSIGLWLRADAGAPPTVIGMGETLLDALAAAFDALAKRHRNDARALRARLSHAA